MNQHSKDLEDTTVGFLLLYPQNLIVIAPILKVEYLYQKNIQTVYTAILRLSKNSEPVDEITVTMQLQKDGLLELAGGPYAVSKLTDRANITVEKAEYNCRIIHQLYILRQVSLLSVEIGNAANEPGADCFEIISRINHKLSEFGDIRHEKIKSVGDIFGELVTDIANVLDNGLPTGLMTGLRNLDKITGGWQRANMIVIAARPGMGKTAMALHLAKYPAMFLNKAVAIFSMEMKDTELVGRLASSESHISSTKINQKSINRYELQSMGASCSKLIEAPLYIDDTPSITLTELRAKAKKLYYEKKVELIIIDYLQLMKGEGKGNREQQVSEISRGIKILAKELDIPIIALSQLSRKSDEREDKRPILSDLRESGSIEQDADIVAFIFRPSEYDMFPNGYEYKDEVLETDKLMLFDIAKGRGLKTGEVALKFYGEFMQILNYDLKSDPGSPSLTTNTNFLNESF